MIVRVYMYTLLLSYREGFRFGRQVLEQWVLGKEGLICWSVLVVYREGREAEFRRTEYRIIKIVGQALKNYAIAVVLLQLW